ncbi:O-antigen ligase family protein [Mycobacterium sp. 48b]|uniref:O-antigen ligase family protein n=1 Tax=Mycobacterium sp. 48b TaxID=3400426 RepID=UPI003AB00A8F
MVAADVRQPIDGRWVGPWVLAAGAFLLLGMRQTFTVPLTFGLSAGQFLLYIGAGLVAMVSAAGRSVVANRWLTVALCGYLVASLVSYGAAMNRGTVMRGIEFGDRYVFSDLALTAMVIAILTSITSRARVQLLIKGLLLGGALSSAFAIVRLSIGIDLAPLFTLPGLKTSDFVLVTALAREGIDRPQGSAGHPLELAGVLTVIIPLGVAVAATARHRGQRAWPWMACTGVLICGALVTVSRSVLVGLTVAVLAMAWRWPITRFAATLLAAVAATGLGLLLNVQVLGAIMASFGNAATDSSIASRGYGATYVATHFRDHFWVGQGAGMYPAYRQPVLDNQYLSRLMETGALGLISFVALLGVALVLALRASAAADPVTAELAGGVSGSLAALAAISLILDVSGFIQIWTVTWILVAISTVLWSLSRRSSPP